MTPRSLQRVITGVAVSDGAGVKLRRSIGQTPLARLDPFLMLDEFGSDVPNDYLAGFPAHPHRGFETVTYMLAGRMRHEDHLGNQGVLETGGVQWMTAGRGIVHSEMPEQQSGLLRGFQLWINLPAAEKMKLAHYQDIPADAIPVAPLAGGGAVKVIAGAWQPDDGAVVTGPVTGISTAPQFFDLRLAPGQRAAQPLPASHHAFVYLYDGAADLIGADGAAQPLPRQAAAVLGNGDAIALGAGPDGASLLCLAAQPLREPVVQYGPFVMNTREQIEQALADWRDGTLA